MENNIDTVEYIEDKPILKPKDNKPLIIETKPINTNSFWFRRVLSFLIIIALFGFGSYIVYYLWNYCLFNEKANSSVVTFLSVIAILCFSNAGINVNVIKDFMKN